MGFNVAKEAEVATPRGDTMSAWKLHSKEVAPTNALSAPD